MAIHPLLDDRPVQVGDARLIPRPPLLERLLAESPFANQLQGLIPRGGMTSANVDQHRARDGSVEALFQLTTEGLWLRSADAPGSA